jgi:hypothetical protein
MKTLEFHDKIVDKVPVADLLERLKVGWLVGWNPLPLSPWGNNK